MHTVVETAKSPLKEVDKKMGSCCMRDKAELPSSSQSPPSPPPHSAAHPASKAAAPPPLLPISRASTQTRTLVSPVSAKSVFSGRSASLRAQVAVPIAPLTQPFEDLYEVKSKKLNLNLGIFTLATHKATQMVRLVMRVERTSAGVDDQVMKDLAVLGHLEHPNLLKADAVLYNQRAIFVISESFNGLKFLDYSTIAEKASEDVIKGLALQMLRGLAYAHAQGHLLKNLSITNVIFFKGANDSILLKLIAFCGREKAENEFSSLKSPHIYRAPESQSGNYTAKADVWSCAVILYILVTNQVPFEGRSAEEFDRAQAEGVKFARRVWGKLGSLQALVGAMLVPDPLTRPTAAQCLLHPCFQALSALPPSALSAAMVNLRKFQGGDRLKLALFTFILMHSFGPEAKTPLQEVFAYINTSGSGLISLQELTQTFLATNRVEVAGPLAASVLRNVDFGLDNFIDFSEFFLATADYRGLFQDKKMKIAFDLFDPSGSGSLSLEELRAVVKFEVEDEAWRSFLRAADTDGSGNVGFGEFTAVVKSIAAEIRRR